jgi:hypothetical protein
MMDKKHVEGMSVDRLSKVAMKYRHRSNDAWKSTEKNEECLGKGDMPLVTKPWKGVKNILWNITLSVL